MNSRPNPAVSQDDRDAIEDLGLADSPDELDDQKLLSHEEPMPS
jgi:hypothetical protein